MRPTVETLLMKKQHTWEESNDPSLGFAVSSCKLCVKNGFVGLKKNRNGIWWVDVDFSIDGNTLKMAESN